MAEEAVSRENWSRAVAKVDLPDVSKEMKSQRSRSVLEAENVAMEQLREVEAVFDPGKPRSVSFNGVSIMVDSVMRVFKSVSKTSAANTDLVNAVTENSLTVVHQMISDETVSVNTALLVCLDQDSVEMVRGLLPMVGDLEARLPESGHGLLHAAAAVGAVGCAGLLLEEGALADAWDTGAHATPLHAAVAAGKNAKQMVELFLNNGGNINAGLDRDGGSVLHHAVRTGNVEVVELLLDNKVDTVPKTFCETALHVAAEQNCVAIAQLLLKSNPGCVDALKGREERSTALHLAADSGYLDICTILLAVGADVSLANSKQETAVHLAAKNRSEPVLHLLLTRAAAINTGLVNARDADGRTPLFDCTASKGHEATKCMKTLLAFGAVVDLQNSGGYTALHMAAIDREPKRVELLITSDADLSLKNNAGFSALHFINKKVPQCMRTYEERLDNGLKLESSHAETTMKIKMDFNKISPNINSLHRQDIEVFMELMKSGRTSILKHPLSQAFLYLKWQQIKDLYLFLHVGAHLIYSIVYTAYAQLVFGILCKQTDIANLNMSDEISTYVPCNFTESPDLHVEVAAARGSWLLLIVFTFIYMAYEGLNMSTNIKRYFASFDSWIDLFLILSFFMISFHQNPFNDSVVLMRIQFHFAALGCFLTWLQVMFYIGKLPKIGKYVQMFKTVCWSVMEFLIAWIFLLLAFTFAFEILFPDYGNFDGFFSTFINLLIFMFGEINYNDLILPEGKTKAFSGIFFAIPNLLLLLFIFLICIVLMNLLVGLAVSDIQTLSKSARLRRLVQQVDLINFMEGWLFTPVFKRFPDWLKKILRSKLQGLKGQNYNMVYTVNPFDMNDKLLPETLKKDLYDNCIR